MASVSARVRTLIRKNSLLRWAAAPIAGSYARMWDIEGLSLRRAKRMMGAYSASEEELEAAGLSHGERVCRFIRPDSRVLDLGCGIGRIARYVAPHCAELIAADVSSRMLHHARRRLAGLRNVRFLRVSGTDLKGVRTASLDFCYCIQVLHQIEREHAMRYMVELSRVIRPGGQVYLQFRSFEHPPNADEFREYALESALLPASRLRYFTEAEVHILARLAGYADARMEKEGDSFFLTARIP